MVVEILNTIFTEEFLRFILGMTVLMLGNAISGVAKGLKANEFSWKVLFSGIRDYAMWAIAAASTVVGLQIFGGDLSITVNEETVTMLQAIEYAEKAVYAYWGAKAIKNFIEYGNIEKNIEVLDPQTTFNTDTIISDIVTGQKSDILG